MKEIRIYSSVWRMSLMILGCMAFVACIFVLKERTSSLLNTLFSWVCIVFFGAGALVMLYVLLRERLTDKPFLIISDECVICNGAWKRFEIRYSEVEKFQLLAGRQKNIIGIHYKEDVERRKLAEANAVGRLVRKFNLSLSGTQESISVSGISMKGEELCKMLNERLVVVTQ